MNRGEDEVVCGQCSAMKPGESGDGKIKCLNFSGAGAGGRAGV